MGLAGAMEEYKALYGEYPPSRAEEFEEHLNRLFPRRDPSEPIPDLDPAEALVFWLRGYSPDPRKPLTRTGDQAPLFDFDERRLTDIDGDGWPEYRPRFYNGSNAPYAYFARPYEGQSYLNIAFRGTATPDPEVAKDYQILSAGPDGDFGGQGSKRRRAEQDNINSWMPDLESDE
jgi:hypothetical protein